MDDMDATLLEFIREYPSEAFLIRETTGEYDPATGDVSNSVEEIPIEAILMDLTLQSNGLSTKYGTLVEAGDKELYMRPVNKTNPLLDPVVIQPATDKIRIGGFTYQIVTFKELNPTAANSVLVTLYLRR